MVISLIQVLLSGHKGTLTFDSIQSNPPPPRSWDWRKSGGIPKTAVLGVIYNLQNPYLGLENGRQYWECGGIGSGGIEGADCTRVFLKRAFGIVSTGCVLFHVSLAPYVVNILWLHVPLHTRLSVAFQDSSIPEQHY